MIHNEKDTITLMKIDMELESEQEPQGVDYWEKRAKALERALKTELTESGRSHCEYCEGCHSDNDYCIGKNFTFDEIRFAERGEY
jgi:hypothetical protein